MSEILIYKTPDNKIKEVTEKNYNNTMQQIGELINSLNVFKKRYDEEYKKELSSKKYS